MTGITALAASPLFVSCFGGGTNIDIDGSSTVFPITQAAAEDFGRERSGMRITVGFSGTGGGFEKFCRGEIEIADASRPIHDDERAKCADEGISDIIELQVATDALTVVVNPDNDWVRCLTVEQLHSVFVDGGAERWSDIDPSWPDNEIVVYYPGADSGTFDYFVEAVIEDGAPDGTDEPAHRSDGTSSEDDNVLVAGVEGDRYGIGYFGFAFYQEAGAGLSAVAIDGGDGCVEPTYDNALAGEYVPLSRPLFAYTSGEILRRRPVVHDLLSYYIDHAAALAEEVGYVGLTEENTAAQRAKLEPYAPAVTAGGRQ